MAITVKHSKVSAVADGPDASVVRPSDWNADHSLEGSVAAGEVSNTPAGNIAATTVQAAINELDAEKAPIYSPVSWSLEKANYALPVFIVTGTAATLSIRAGTRVRLADGSVKAFAAQTAITMPALTAGEDYCVWVKPDGTAQCTADPYSAPAAAPVAGSLKIGGFHYSLTAYNTTPAAGSFATTGFTTSGGNYIWTQAAINRIAGINEFSLWDLHWRCKGEQRGMTLDYETLSWHGIYFCGTEHITNGPSRYNTNICSGTVLPKIPLVYGGTGANTYGRCSQYECEEIAASFGLRLPEIHEFRSAMYGVTEAQALGGSTVTVPATLRQPGYTSRIGVEQATGHEWIFARGNMPAGGSAWVPDPERGQSYGNLYVTLLGADRIGASGSGSRASSSNSSAWNSYWNIALRVAGDHLMPAGSPR